MILEIPHEIVSVAEFAKIRERGYPKSLRLRLHPRFLLL